MIFKEARMQTKYGGVTMRGKTDWQIREVFKTHYCIGEERRVAKLHFYSNSGKHDSHALSGAVGVFSYGTYDQYRDISLQFATWVKQEYGIKDITKITEEHAKAWAMKLKAEGISKSTSETYIAGISKFAGCMTTYTNDRIDRNKWQNSMNKVFGENVKFTHKEVAGTKGYKDVAALIAALPQVLPRVGEKYMLGVAIYYETAARCREVRKIYPHQLKGNELTYTSKGGKKMYKVLTEETAGKLKTILNRDGKFILSDTTLHRGLRLSAKATNQKYEGVHGIRHTVAKELYRDLILDGASHYEALQGVSRFLGHERPGITLVYLRTGKEQHK
jgi:integrase